VIAVQQAMFKDCDCCALKQALKYSTVHMPISLMKEGYQSEAQLAGKSLGFAGKKLSSP
jgi:hypothetical protein